MIASVRRALLHLLLALVVLVFLAPIVWFLLLAIRPPQSGTSGSNSLLFVPDLTALHYVFVSPGQGRSALLASLLQAGASTVIALPLAVAASYGLTRFKFRGRRLLSTWYLGLMLAPPVVFVLPLFVVMSRLGLIGGNLGVILTFQTFAIPLGVLLLRGFFEDIPMEIEEAGLVDGCGRMRCLIRVVLPMVAPGLVVAGVFIFVFCWNNLIFAMPMTGGRSVPLTVRALSYFATSGISWNYIAATAAVSMAVPMLLFWALRRHIVSGLTFGAVKG
ncbi:MAG: carbohydrate ABC transporter permease [Actinocatenispora sp.]